MSRLVVHSDGPDRTQIEILTDADGWATATCPEHGEVHGSYYGPRVVEAVQAHLDVVEHTGTATGRVRIMVFTPDASRRLAEFEAADPREVEIWRAGFEIGFGRPYTFEITEVTKRP